MINNLKMHYKLLGVNGNVRMAHDISPDPNEQYDWIYCHGPVQLCDNLADIEYFCMLCNRAKHVAVVYHTKKTGKRIKGRIHYKRHTLDSFFGNLLVNSFTRGNFYYAILSNNSYKWGFVTLNDLMEATLELIPKIPESVTSIVGMHRSGTPSAAIIASLLHLPCYIYSDSNGLIKTSGGGRTNHLQEQEGVSLVVDDTICRGGSIERARKRLSEIAPNTKFLYSVIFSSLDGINLIDFYSRILPRPHFLEWNLLNCFHITTAAVDLDGVLCYDPPYFDETNEEDRERYLNWIINAKPKYPARHVNIDTIVSYRCEYTRAATEEWLRKQGIKYNHLLLFPGQPQERNWSANQWKGAIYKNKRLKLFVESSSKQAMDIAAFTKKPVIDLERKIIIR